MMTGTRMMRNDTLAAYDSFVSARREATQLTSDTNAVYTEVFDEMVAEGYAFIGDLDPGCTERVAGHGDLYLVTNEYETSEYYRRANERIRALYDVPEGQCPALIADRKVTKLESEVMRLVDRDMGLNMVDGIHLVEIRKKFIKIIESIIDSHYRDR